MVLHIYEALAIRAGIPQAAFPFMADQFENGKLIVKLGLGSVTCNFKIISAKAISDAINVCIKNESHSKNSLKISEKIKNSNGLDLTINLTQKKLIKSKT